MATYRIFYRNEFPKAGFIPDFVNLQAYKQVVVIEAECHEATFGLMNAVYGEELPCKLGIRSMSVGDVAYEVETGKAFYCAPVGWVAMVVWDEDDVLKTPFEVYAEPVEQPVEPEDPYIPWNPETVTPLPTFNDVAPPAGTDGEDIPF